MLLHLFVIVKILREKTLTIPLKLIMEVNMHAQPLFTLLSATFGSQLPQDICTAGEGTTEISDFRDLCDLVKLYYLRF